MLPSIRLSTFRRAAHLALLLPFAAAAACSSDADTVTPTPGGETGTDGAVTGDATADSGTSGSDGSTSGDDAAAGSDTKTAGSDTKTSGGDSASASDTKAGDSAPDAVIVPDLTAPKVVSNEPDKDEIGVTPAAVISATFNERMKSTTITNTTFTLAKSGVAVLGKVTYFGRTATFAPSAPLALDSTYTATIGVAATDVAGNPLAAPHTWSFKTALAAPIGPAPVYLGGAGRFVILAEAAVSNAATSKVTGDIGLSPAAASYITGFVLTRAGTYWTATEVTGQLFAADNDPPTPTDLTVAIGDMHTAYTDAAGRTATATNTNLGSSGNIGGLTITPGLYKWTTDVTVQTDVTFSGGANDVWILQIDKNFTMAEAKKMVLVGARPKNIFWQIAGGVTFGTTAHAEGIVLSKTAVTLATGASINGRLYGQTAVNIAGSTVTAPAP